MDDADLLGAIIITFVIGVAFGFYVTRIIVGV